MIVSLLLFGPPIATGTFLTGALLRLPNRRSSLLFIVSAGILVGMAVYGLLYALTSLLLPSLHSVRTALEIALLIGSLFIFYKNDGVQRIRNYWTAPASRNLQWVDALAGILFLSMAVLYYNHAKKMPHGAWDAVAMWNVKARFLAVTGGDVQGLVESSYGNNDYPLLLPSINARLFSAAGSLDEKIPLMTMYLQFLALLGMMLSSVSLLQNRRIAYVVAAAFFSLGLVHMQFMLQYADTLVATTLFAFSAVLILKPENESERGSSLMVGLFAGMLLFTKNEGIAIVLALMVGLVAYRIMKKTNPISWVYALSGAAPFIIALLVFRLAHPVANGIVSGATPAMLQERLMDLSRIATILRGGYTVLIESNLIPSFWIAVLILAPFVFRLRMDWMRILLLIGLPLFLVLTIYFAVYLITPYDVAWHVRTSVDRLAFHLFPTSVLLVIAICKNTLVSPDEDTLG